MRLNALLQDARFQPLAGAEVTAELSGPGGASRRITFAPGGAGTYSAEFASPGPGRWQVNARPRAGQRAGTRAWRVRGGPLDTGRCAPSPTAVRSPAIAEASGGRVGKAADAARWARCARLALARPAAHDQHAAVGIAVAVRTGRGDAQCGVGLETAARADVTVFAAWRFSRMKPLPYMRSASYWIMRPTAQANVLDRRLTASCNGMHVVMFQEARLGAALPLALVNVHWPPSRSRTARRTSAGHAAGSSSRASLPAWSGRMAPLLDPLDQRIQRAVQHLGDVARRNRVRQ